MRARETKFAEAVLTEVEADGGFCGYASLFGEADLSRDVVMPGAFAKSIRARGPGGIRMLFQHDPATRSGCGGKSARMGAGCSCAAG
jgi:phage head maturation protease